MKFDNEWIKRMASCKDGEEWLVNSNLTDSSEVIKKLIEEEQWNWAEWAISRSLDKKHNILWAIFCAEQVLPLFEKTYPNDDRPRKAIEAAKVFAIDPNEENRSAAYAAYAAANAANAAAYAAANAANAANAAYAAYAAAYAAANAAHAAASVHAANAANAAAYATYAAANATYAAANAAAEKDMRIRCILFGLKLLEEE